MNYIGLVALILGLICIFITFKYVDNYDKLTSQLKKASCSASYKYPQELLDIQDELNLSDKDFKAIIEMKRKDIINTLKKVNKKSIPGYNIPEKVKEIKKPASKDDLRVEFTTTINVPLEKGLIKIPLEGATDKGFKEGQKIIIDQGNNAEERFIVGIGSLILDKPLSYNHPKGIQIRVLQPNKQEKQELQQRQQSIPNDTSNKGEKTTAYSNNSKRSNLMYGFCDQGDGVGWYYATKNGNRGLMTRKNIKCNKGWNITCDRSTDSCFCSLPKSKCGNWNPIKSNIVELPTRQRSSRSERNDRNDRQDREDRHNRENFVDFKLYLSSYQRRIPNQELTAIFKDGKELLERKKIIKQKSFRYKDEVKLSQKAIKKQDKIDTISGNKFFSYSDLVNKETIKNDYSKPICLTQYGGNTYSRYVNESHECDGIISKNIMCNS